MKKMFFDKPIIMKAFLAGKEEVELRIFEEKKPKETHLVFLKLVSQAQACLGIKSELDR